MKPVINTERRLPEFTASRFESDTDEMKAILLLGIFTTCAAVPKNLSGKMFTFPKMMTLTSYLVKRTPSLTPFDAVTLCQDLSGKMFTFPKKTTTSYVKLTPSLTQFDAVTLCLRSKSDMRRDHALFSLSLPNYYDALLLLWRENKKGIDTYVKNTEQLFETNRKLNMWHSTCVTWESSSGVAQLWFDGRPSTRKFIVSGSSFNDASMSILLGQEQDSHGGSFELEQSFVGMMADVHMWNYVMSACQILAYTDGRHFTAGNVINWNALEYTIFDKVMVEDKQTGCHQSS